MSEQTRYGQNETSEAALRFARTGEMIPAPEPSHAIPAGIEEADAATSGTLEDAEFSAADTEQALAVLPDTPAIA